MNSVVRITEVESFSYTFQILKFNFCISEKFYFKLSHELLIVEIFDTILEIKVIMENRKTLSSEKNLKVHLVTNLFYWGQYYLFNLPVPNK